jgi:hypothetical protein
MQLLAVQRVHELVFAGRFSPTSLAIAGVVLAGIILVLTRWETRWSRRWVGPAVGLLRIAALIVALWMLAEPSMQTIVRHERDKSIAVFVDTSASMGVADPPENSAAHTRWALFGTGSVGSGPVALLDAAAATVSASKVYCSSIARACGGRAAPGKAAHCATRAEQCLLAAGEHLQAVAGQLKSFPVSDRNELDTLWAMLTKVSPRLAELADEFNNDQVISSPSLEDRLAEAVKAVTVLDGRLWRLADRVAETFPAHADPATRNRLSRQQADRARQVTALLDDAESSWLGEIESRARVNRYCFGRVVTPTGADDWSRLEESAKGAMATNLTTAIEQATRDAASGGLEAVVLLTDGGHNTGREPVKSASALGGVPIFVVPIGNTKPVRDIILHHVHGPRTVLKSDRIVIEATIDAHGCEAETLRVELVQDDAVIETQTITIASDAFTRHISFLRQPGGMGKKVFQLRVAPVPDEQTEGNNLAEFHCEVVEDTIRVLLVDELPRWEYRYLRNLFDRDEQIEMTSLLLEPRKRRTGGPAEGAGFPAELDDWSRYRVVILGDVAAGYMPSDRLDMLEQYVGRRGGTLIIVAGQEAMPAAYGATVLEPLLPVTRAAPHSRDRNGFSLHLTPEGRMVSALQLTDNALSDDRLWRDISARMPVYCLSAYSQPKPTSHVLIAAVHRGLETGDERAFLSWRHYGAGRVVYISAPVTWKLRFREGDVYHHRFWGQLLRWAMSREIGTGSRTIRLSADGSRYSEGEPINLTVRMLYPDGKPVKGASPVAEARQGGRELAKIELAEDNDAPGTYRGVLEEMLTGPVTVGVTGRQVSALLESEGWSSQVTAVVTVEPNKAMELRNTRCNLPMLTQLADATGGAVLGPTALGAMMEQLDLESETFETISSRPVWNSWTLLLIFVGCLTAEWIIRKRVGMA